MEEGKDSDEMSLEAGVQTKLTVGAVGDKYEQEADQVAAQVMSMSVAPDHSPQVQRFGEEDNPVQRWSLAQSITPVVHRRVDEQVQMRSLVQRAFQAGGNEASGDLESRLNASKSGGSALAPEVRAFMEPRFGADFSAVRVHTGSEAVQMNRELGAQAFAHGSDVYFGAGKSPGNNELTAHELTHVVQQMGGVQMQQKDENSTLQTKESTDKKLQDDSHHRIASDITGVFEGGKPGSLQTVDTGIISYGKHQATLASGSLYSVLKAYTDYSKSSTAINIAEYLGRVQKKDVTLRDNKVFIQLLKDAASEPEMARAQEEVFSKDYWNPAKRMAEKAGIKSALGEAIFYDTKIQGGLETVLKNTQQRLKDKKYTEQEFLSVFLEEREKRLYEIAKGNRTKAEQERTKGNEKKAKRLEKNAKMLENSAKNRVGALDALVKSGNLNLIGDEKEQIKVGTTKIAGLGKGATSSNTTSGANSNSNLATGANTATIGTATVTSANLNVRKAPSVSDPRLGSLYKGDQIEVIGRTGEWLNILYKGQPAFIHSNYTNLTSKSASQDNSKKETSSSKTYGVEQSTTSSQSAKTTQSPDNSHQEKKSESKAETSQVKFHPSDPRGYMAKLHPNLQAKVQGLIENAHKKGLNVWIVQGMRTIEEQNDLYAQGRTKGQKGKTVTKAKGGDSYHNYGLAVDVVFHGSQPYGESHNWTALGEAGKEAGLEWGGDWKSFKDRPHFQISGLSISQLKAWYASGSMENVWKNVSAK
jgi:uncharacterized protein YraI